MVPARTLVAWCPDWPVVAAGAGGDQAVAVVAGAAVVACSAAARAAGVRPGLRRGDAQAHCPGLTVVPTDPGRDTRAFEAVAAAVEALTPSLEVVGPGTLALPTRGPSRRLGGDHALAAQIATVVGAVLEGRGRCQVGVADGLFPALLAARQEAVVPPGGGAAFLAPLPVAALRVGLGAEDGSAEEVGLLPRLGLRTLGEVAAIPTPTLVGRFGMRGLAISRLARGLDVRPLLLRPPAPDLAVATELDPPAQGVEAAAFAARALATELASRLADRGLSCARVSIEAETATGETLVRRWRHDGTLGPGALADRVRWQLDGFLTGTAGVARPRSGLVALRLVPDEVVAGGHQLGLWGEVAATDRRAARGLARLQGLLGPEEVLVPTRRGGRGPGEQVALVPAPTGGSHRPEHSPEPKGPGGGGTSTGASGLGGGGGSGDPPWPGRLPPPSPTVVHARPPEAEVLDADGGPVGVSGRGLVTAAPRAVSVGGGPSGEVVAWAGPWPVDERWWDPATHRRRARIQVVTATGAHLLALEGRRWRAEATYD